MYVILIIYLTVTVFSILRSFIRFSSPLPEPPLRLVFGFGVFDGVHIGHRTIIANLSEMAAASGAHPVAVTFSPHPRAVVCPDDPPALLLPLEERLRLLHEVGAGYTGVIDFTAQFAALSPERFLAGICGGNSFSVCGICVGEKWRFGRFGAGDTAFLARWCSEHSLAFRACPELTVEGRGVVSSTAIRRLTAAGELDAAAEMLGRWCRIFGRVVHGFRVAGGILDAPTANLELAAGVVPPDGVYCGGVRLDGEIYPAAVNIGRAPTFDYGRKVHRIEAHLPGFSGELYGREIELELYRRLRPERAFADAGELKRQIAADISEVVAVFSEYQRRSRS